MKSRVLLVLLALAAAACERKAPEVVPQKPDPTPVVDDVGVAASASPTLKAVKARGALRCGVNPGLAGFAFADAGGRWRGFDADLCRAVAAAVLGDGSKVQFVPLTNDVRFAALKSGQVDLLARNTSWTYTRDAGEAVDFAGISYHDGQGFLAPKTLALQSAAELSGAKVCFLSGTTSELNLRDWFAARSVNWTPSPMKTEAALRAAYDHGDCDVMSADISALASARATLADPGAHVLLPDVISKEPLSPVVRQGDPGWTDIVRWTLNALILAEEMGVTAKTADQMATDSGNPEVRRLLGSDTGYGGMLGLDDLWARRAIKAVGNYGELFERNLGAKSALKLERGLNAPWNAEKPGLLYAPPIR